MNQKHCRGCQHLDFNEMSDEMYCKLNDYEPIRLRWHKQRPNWCPLVMQKERRMKAYVASDRNGDSGYSIVVFAETAGQAKAYASNSEEFDNFEFTEIRVNRCKALDSYYRGNREMDWLNDEDRIAMVRYANFECSSEVWNPECETEECPAQKWCGRYERMKDE